MESIVLVKRETGESPVRTRHCKQYKVVSKGKLKPLETGRRYEQSCKSGDLPIGMTVDSHESLACSQR